MKAKKPEPYPRITFRIDAAVEAALTTIEASMGKGIRGRRSAAIRRAILEYAETLHRK